MTVYVIDASNPRPPTTGRYEDALRLYDGDMVILMRGAELRASGYMSQAIGAYGGRVNLLIDGAVYSDQSYGIWMSGTVSIGHSGIVAGVIGILAAGETSDSQSDIVNNAGLITAIDYGVYVRSDHGLINNSGEITGSYGIFSFPAGNSAASLTINNTGVIRGTGTTAIVGSAQGSNTVINSGQIEGTVFFGTGNDIYDGRYGHITGDVYLYSGNDVALGGSSSETFHVQGGTHFIDGGEGIDTIRFDRQVFVDLRVVDEQKTSDTTWDTIRNVENLIGSSLPDRLYGSDTDNILSGDLGNDLLEGNNGDDRLIGGNGNDSLSGGFGTDVAVFRSNFSDYVINKRTDGSFSVKDLRSIPFDGTDSLIGIEYAQFADRTIALTSKANSAPTSISLSGTLIDGDAPAGALVAILSGVDPDGDALGYSLVTNPGDHFRIHGNKLLVDKAFTDRSADIVITVRASDPHGASIDRSFTIDVDPDVISIPEDEFPVKVNVAASLTLNGGRKADILAGGDGDDRLNGGLGKDRMTGGEGDDVFAFTTRLGKANVDRILDFSSSEDTIHLSSKIFGRLSKGALSEEAFHIGAKAAEADDRIIFNKRTGALSYDADGSGTQYGAIKFAQLKAKTVLTADDLFIV
jgi:Ca2+-binding RTX toxin-like protein